jgi:hypothetical protein
MSTSTEAVLFSNVSASPAAFNLRGGKYAVAASATGSGTMGLSMVGPDGSTLIPVFTAFSATTGYAVVDLPPGRYQFVLATFTAVYASICRIPS